MLSANALSPLRMLDHVCIFSKTGVVFWSMDFASVKTTVGGEHPVNALVSNVRTTRWQT